METRTKVIIGAVAALVLATVVVIIIIAVSWFSQPAATISVEPTSLQGRSGAGIMVTGSNFPAKREIYVGLAAPGVPPAAGTTFMKVVSGQDGKFKVPFPYPNDPNWTKLDTVTVYAGTPEGDVVATASLSLSSIAWQLTPSPAATPSPTPVPSATATAAVTATATATPSPTSVTIPTISLQPAAGRPGITVVVIGRGWRPNDQLTLSLLGSDAQIPSVGTDGRGEFKTAFVFPANWTGSAVATLVVRTQDGSAQTVASFQVHGLVTPTVPTPTPFIITGWLGQYYGNILVAGDPVLTRNDDDINFDWGSNSPAPGVVPNQRFSVRWTRTMYFPSGSYRFWADADDGVRLWLDGKSVIDEWRKSTGAKYSGDVSGLSEGLHAIRVEYYQDSGVARVKVWWQQVPPTATNTPTLTSTPTVGVTTTVTSTIPSPSPTP